MLLWTIKLIGRIERFIVEKNAYYASRAFTYRTLVISYDVF